MENTLAETLTNEEVELQEWIDSLNYVLQHEDRGQTTRILRRLLNQATCEGVRVEYDPVTPYVNTIPANEEPVYPGNLELESRLDSLIRWNALAMVVRANRKEHGIGAIWRVMPVNRLSSRSD